MTVITFPGNQPPEEKPVYIWLCSCGCQSFELRSDGSVQCCNCDKIDTQGINGEWFNLLPRPSDKPKEREQHGMIVTRIDESNAALRKVLDDVNEKDTAFVVVAQENGIALTWRSRNFNESDSVWWLDDQLARARSMILPTGIDPNDLDGMRARITNSDELHSVIVIRQDGDVAIWISKVSGPPESKEQVEWLDRKLAMARDLYLDKNYLPPDELQPDLFKDTQT